MKTCKKKQLFLSITSLCMGAMFALGAGCGMISDLQKPVGITGIEKTETKGLVDVYTIYYSDGTTGTFEVTNGKDGKDGKNGADGEKGETGSFGGEVSVEQLYQAYKEIYGEQLTYAEFLALYLTVDSEQVEDSSKIVADCLQSTGKVFCEFTEYNTSTADKTDTILTSQTGSCVIYSIDEEYTYFLTNYHVIYDEDSVTSKITEKVHCYLYGSESAPTKKTDSSGNTYSEYDEYAIPCEFIGGAATYDLAFLRASTSDVKKINENVKAVTLAEDYYVGQKAIAIGNPLGEGLSATEGIVSVDNENISLSVGGKSQTYRSIRIDTPVYKGNSGGGLFNKKGELIGIVNAGKLTEENINYAIPVQIIKAMTENFWANFDGQKGSVSKITIGVTVRASDSKYVYDAEKGYGQIQETVTIKEVKSDGIAGKMGLRVDDVLSGIEIDGVYFECNRLFDIGDRLLILTKGVKFRFQCVRNGAKIWSESYTVNASDLSIVE